MASNGEKIMRSITEEEGAKETTAGDVSSSGIQLFYIPKQTHVGNDNVAILLTVTVGG